MQVANRDNIIHVSGLCKSFGAHVVLNDFHLDLAKGESKVVLGRSGSGKSILIKCIIGLMKPDSGKIEVFGKDILAMDHDELDEIRIRVGFLFQSNALYDSMTIRENLEFPMRRHSIALTTEEAEERVMEALENVGLKQTADMMPAELSGGMQKRVALARTLILKPEIILYDEPTAGLDPITGLEIINLIKNIQEKYQASALIISHDMRCVRSNSDSVIVLANGRNYKEASYSDLQRSDDPIVKHFFD